MIRTSHSQRQAWNTCHQMWNLQTVEKLQSTKKPMGRYMGEAYSLALEGLDEAQETIEAFYSKLLIEHPENEQDLLTQLVVVDTFAELYRELHPEPAVREVPFEVEIDGGRILNVGYLDGVADDWLIEDKLLSSMSWHKRSHEHLAVDAQVTGYIHAARAMNLPTNLMYRVAIKPGIRLKRTETEGEFRRRLTQTVWSEREKYFVEIPCTRTADQLNQFEKDVIAIVDEQQAAASRGEFRHNNDACISKYGPCEFANLCWGLPGAADGFKKRQPRQVGQHV